MYRRRSLGPVGLVAIALSLVGSEAFAGAGKVPASPSPSASRLTFNKDIAPILFGHCATCHRPGEAAPFSLLTYEDARSRAQLLADATERKFMPPWMPEPEFGEFEGVRLLTDDQIHAFRRWADEGAVEGDPKDLPPVPAFTGGWQLGLPDLVVSMPESFSMPAAGQDLFRNFVLPVSLKSKRHVRAIEFRPGGAKAIHHARILIDESRESRWRDAQDPEVGFAGMDAPGARFPDGHFLGWAAGKSANANSLAWPLEAGSDLVVQMHLKPTGKAESIRASIGFYFSNKAPAAAPVMLRLGSRTIDIPAGMADYVITDSYELPVDTQALRIYPHAHYLGKEITVTARMPDGRTERLLHIPNWDFNWQDDYEYARPVPLPKGAAVTMRFVYDNSGANPRNPNNPPARVRFGPLATDEMAELLVQLVPRKPSELGTLKAEIARKTLVTEIQGEEKRIADDPDDVDVRHSLAVHYLQTGRGDEAMVQFAAVLKRAPNHALANYNLAVVAMGRGQLDEARARFERALASRPEYSEAHSNYGVLLQRTGKFEEAEKHFRAALAIKPGNASARNNLGRALLRQGRPEQAIQQFQELVRIQPENPAALDALAEGYAAAGHFGEAVRVAEFALSRAHASKDEPLARAIRQRLLIYQQQTETEAR